MANGKILHGVFQDAPADLLDKRTAAIVQELRLINLHLDQVECALDNLAASVQPARPAPAAAAAAG